MPKTIEESVTEALDAQESDEIEEVIAADEEEGTGDNQGGEDGDSPENEDGISDEPGDGAEEDDDGADESEDIAASDESGDGEPSDSSEDHEESLEPPEHWAAADKEKFTSVPREAQEFILDRHKAMEGDYTRRTQEIAPIRRQFEAIQDALAPYEAEFQQAGLDHAGAVRQLAYWHTALKSDPKQAIQQLAQTYGVDLSESDEEVTDPALKSVLKELGQVKQSLSRSEQQAQQTQQQQLLDQIQAFETATGDDGRLLHPHFKTLEDKMTALFNAKLASSLEDAYNQALALSPDLKPAPPKKPKVNPAEKVKQAKRAAAGVKSSGTGGQKPPPKLSLEQSVAAAVDNATR